MPSILRPGALGAILLALALCGVAVGSALAAEPIRVTDASFGEGDVITRRGDVRYLWASEPTTLHVTLETGTSEGQGHYDVCVRTTPPNGSAREIVCRSVLLTGNATEQIAFEFDAWPAGRGSQTVEVIVTADTLSREVAARASHEVVVLSKTADGDGDGATNRRELRLGTNFSRPDTDGDGLADGLELDTHGTNPTAVDTDGDGLRDGPEVREYATEPTAADTDDDGLADALEAERYGTDPNRVDTDGDGLSDALEVNTYETDATAADTDGDGLGDADEVTTHETNPTSGDTDGDGLADALEVYTFETSPTRVDSDDDGLTDGREVYRVRTDPTGEDTDGDGLADGEEVSAHGTNPNRADTDGDGLRDGREVNAFDTDPTTADTDGDGRGDALEVDEGPRIPLVPVGVALLAAGAVSSVAWLTRDSWLPRVPVGVRARFGASRLGSLARPGGATDAPARNGSPDGADATAPTGRPDAGPHADPPVESLTDEEAVLSVLRANGGRIRQSHLVEETDWSKSKVSRVLARMDDADQVTKINVGRGNVITLPGAEPPSSSRPFEDD